MLEFATGISNFVPNLILDCKKWMKNEVCVWTLILPPRLFLKLMFTFELCKILLDSLFFNPIGQGYRNKYNLVSCERKRELLSVLKKGPG